MSTLNHFGFELEGEFSNELMQKLTPWGKMVSDGSVRSCSSSAHTKPYRHSLNTREFVLNHIAVEKLKTLQPLFVLLDKAYKNGEFHFNDSSGFHIHVSFNPEFPREIFSKHFVSFFLKTLKLKQKDVIAKRQDNHFCRLNVPTSEILDTHCNERYRFVNLWPAYQKHGTVEFRIFPSNEPKKCYRYVVFTLNLLKKYLATDRTLVRSEIKFNAGELKVTNLPTTECTLTPKVLNFIN